MPEGVVVSRHITLLVVNRSARTIVIKKAKPSDGLCSFEYTEAQFENLLAFSLSFPL